MRKIKFRAWHFKLKRMFSAEEMTKDQMALLPDGHFANIHSASTRLSKILSHDEMLPLQYTGLKDKNGKEIYEGDILQIETENHEIIKVLCESGLARRTMDTGMEVDIPSFYFKRDDGLKSFPVVKNWKGKHDLEIIEIIGNIYENKDLIKGM